MSYVFICQYNSLSQKRKKMFYSYETLIPIYIQFYTKVSSNFFLFLRKFFVPKKAMYCNNNWIYNKQGMFRVLFPPSKEIFYTNTIHASITNSMSEH